MDEMLRSISSTQFQEWVSFSELEPFGYDRADARIGMLTQVMRNVHRDTRHRKAPYTLRECVPSPPGDAFTTKRQQSVQEMLFIGMAAAGMSHQFTEE